MKGFPSPYHMRTVEGDLGLRSNAVSIIEQVGSDSILKSVGIKNINLETITRELSTKISKIPKSRAAKTIDLALAQVSSSIGIKTSCWLHHKNLYTYGKNECPIPKRPVRDQLPNIDWRNLCALR